MWRQHPTSRAVLKYINDYRTQIAEELAGAVIQGISPTPERVQESALRCEMLRDIHDIDAAMINDFYGITPPEEKPQSDIGETE